jgi:hypothetical protein
MKKPRKYVEMRPGKKERTVRPSSTRVKENGKTVEKEKKYSSIRIHKKEEKPNQII